MSTAFYLKANISPININCKIGLRSNESFYSEPQFNLGLINRHNWIPFLKELGKSGYDVEIHDEYDRTYSIEEFLKEVGWNGEG